MELEKIYQAIITGRAMLITGSGAHMTALGMNGEKFPSGVALAERLYKSAGIVNPENPYDLQDAADSYLETKSSDELIAELKKVLYVSKVQKEHEILYGQDWQRVYTTNYDEVPILASKDMEEPLYAVTLSDDVKLEKSKKKQCVFDNYINVLEKFAFYSLEDVQFILTARTVLYDTRIREANEILKVGEGESKVIDLNKLNEKELNVMSNILRNNGLWGNLSNLSRSEKKKRLKDRKWGNSEFQSILVDVVNSTDMKNKIETIVSGIKSVSVSYYEVLILALLVKIMSLNIDAQDIGKIIGVNAAFDPRFTQDENVQEILDFSKEATDFRIKSAVTANLILKELDCNDVIIKVLELTAEYANRYRTINRYENILKNIISYSHVNTFLLKSGQKEKFLVNYYDSLKELEYYRENTFFWLQYAIACANIGKYDLAQRFLEAAYSFFHDSEYTVPFQVDTQQARLYLLRIENEKNVDVADYFEKAHLLLMKPAVSLKDNEEKQIQLLRKYVAPAVLKKLPSDFKDRYRRYCGEAYNKVHEFLKKNSSVQVIKNYQRMEKQLLKASLVK